MMSNTDLDTIIPSSSLLPCSSTSPVLSSELSLETTRAYLQAATAPRTRHAYQADIRHFEHWGGALPATPEQIAAYLQAYASTLNPHTLSRRLTALKHWHTYQGFTDSTATPFVRQLLKGIMNTHGQPKNQAPPLTPTELKQLVKFLHEDATLAAYRDSALLQFGYFAALRRSELVAITCEQLDQTEEGIILMIPRSKTDQAGEGQQCAVPFGHDALCPIRALKQWLAQANITQGPVFRRLDRWGTLGHQPLTPLAVTQILKRRAKACGLVNAKQLSSHSLRRGLASSASEKGASLKAIMRQGRWKQVSTVLEYIEIGQRFKDNAARVILHDDDI